MTGSATAAVPAGFLFQREVASAALTSVVRATQVESGAAVLVKRLRPRGQGDAAARAAFTREARIGEALARAGARVPPVVARGADELGPYLVTGAVGEALETLLGTLGVDGAGEPEWMTLGRTAFAALSTVHDAADDRGPLAVVHRDVHLDNLRWADGGRRAWLVDFGLASARPDLEGDLPADDAVFRGTVRYAAPEAARGESCDASSDRFSLAVALLHRASGIDPRGGAREPAELLYRAGDEPLEAWRASIEQAAAPEIAASVRHLARALEPLLAFAPRDRRTAPAW